MRTPAEVSTIASSDVRSTLRSRLDADVRALASIERPSASPGEEAAASWVQSRLRDLGLEADVEEFQFNPDVGTAWSLHGLVAVLSAALGLRGGGAARLGAAVSALNAVSFWGDATTEFHLLRRLLPRSTSYNVLARLPNPSAERVLIVSAHHDTSHSGIVFHPAILRTVARLRGEPAPPPLQIPFFSMIAASAAAALRGIGIRHGVLLGCLAAGGLLNAAFAALMHNVSRSGVSPGANDDASGIAVLLALADGLASHQPGELEVWFLSTGSEEGLLGGMCAFIERHGAELRGRRPFVLNLEMTGSGRPVYIESEGFLRRYPYMTEAVDLARDVAAQDEFAHIGSLVVAPFLSDALIATRSGIPAITIASTNHAGYVPNYHWATDVADNVDLSSVEDAYAFSRRLITHLDRGAS